MIGKRISAVIFLILMVAGMAAVSLRASFSSLGGLPQLLSGETASLMEQSFSSAFPFREQLLQLGWDIRFASGNRQEEGCFIGNGHIIPNISAPSERCLEQNIDGIARFAAVNSRIPVYFALIPTAAAIEQDDLPEFSTSYMVNQKGLIEEIYQALSGSVSTVDIYGSLFNNNEKYLYYRTEDNLTALGGYYVYSSIGARMGHKTRSLGDFDIQYARHDFVGSLGQQFPYARVKPDIISLFHYRKYGRRYRVETLSGGEELTMGSLYDMEKLSSENPMEVYLGERGTMTAIYVEDGPYSQRLLVFADKSCLSWLPMLANHYEEVLLVDLESATSEEIRYLDTFYYDQVLFAYSTDTFMHQDYISAVSRN